MPTNIITERIIGAELELGLTYEQSLRRAQLSISSELQVLPEESAYVKEWFDLAPAPTEMIQFA